MFTETSKYMPMRARAHTHTLATSYNPDVSLTVYLYVRVSPPPSSHANLREWITYNGADDEAEDKNYEDNAAENIRA